MFLATPCYRGAPSEPTQRTGDAILARYGGSWGRVEGCPWVGNARSELVAEFLDTNESHLLFIDADISFPLATVDRMLASPAPVVCVKYPRRLPPHTLVEGLGCTLVARGVFEALWAAWPQLTYLRGCNDKPAVHIFAHAVGMLDGSMRIMGEDQVFYRRVRASSFAIEMIDDPAIIHDGIRNTSR